MAITVAEFPPMTRAQTAPAVLSSVQEVVLFDLNLIGAHNSLGLVTKGFHEIVAGLKNIDQRPILPHDHAIVYGNGVILVFIGGKTYLHISNYGDSIQSYLGDSCICCRDYRDRYEQFDSNVLSQDKRYDYTLYNCVQFLGMRYSVV